MTGTSFVCSVPGAVPGETTVSGDAYLQNNFEYSYGHIWRNLGILIGFWVFFLLTYLFAVGLNLRTAEVESLLFLRGRKPKGNLTDGLTEIGESGYQASSSQQIESDMEIRVAPMIRTFTWRDVTYDIGAKTKRKRLLNNISGYAESGTLTALMGVSGAGKTTLLDALARRLLAGTVSGGLAIEGVRVGQDYESKIGKAWLPTSLAGHIDRNVKVMFSSKTSISKPQLSEKRSVSAPHFVDQNQSLGVRKLNG